MRSVKLTYPSACCLRAHMEHLWPRISGAATHDATQWNQKQVAGRLQIRELAIGFPLSSWFPCKGLGFLLCYLQPLQAL